MAGMGGSALDEELRRSNVVHVRGVPFSATEAELAQAFQGLELGGDGAVICVNFQGRSTGHAYVHFASADFANQAAHSRHFIGGRPIMVSKAHPADMQGALRMVGRVSVNEASCASVTNTGIPGMAGNPDLRYKGVVRMRGLPYRSTSADIMAFFSGLKIVPDGIFLCTHDDGRPNGEAFVEFADEETTARALWLRKEPMGMRYVDIYRSTKGEMLTAIQQRMYALFAGLGGFSSVCRHKAFAGMNLAAIQGAGLGISALPGVGDLSAATCIKMRGLPFNAQQQDVMMFFEGYRIVPNGVHILSGLGDRPLGEAFVEFVSADESQRAMEQHQHMMGPRHIDLFRVTKSAMLVALGGLPGSNMSQQLDPSIQLLLLQEQAATGAFAMGGLIGNQGPHHHGQVHKEQTINSSKLMVLLLATPGGGTMKHQL